MSVHAETLDPAVGTAKRDLEERPFPSPKALLLLGTGVGFLPDRLEGRVQVDLSEVAGVPDPWNRAELFAGTLAGLDVWLLDDLSAEAASLESGPPWVRAFPLWLAAAAGARVLVHTSAGASLGTAEASPKLGELVALSDHINFSGRTPLLGLGPCKYGPLFPDQSSLHRPSLRQSALRAAARLGFDLPEAVAACTSGPSLDTPAERRFYGRAGANVAVQGLESPLIAAAHAGLDALCFVAITDSGEGRADLVRLLERSRAAAPAVEDLLLAVAPAVAESIRAREAEDA